MAGKTEARAVEKRHEIMRAAETLFAGRRYHEVTLDAVARVAGVSKGTIYNHFSDKEDLFFRLVTSGFDELCGVLNEKLPSGAGFREQLVVTAREVTRFFAERRPLFRMMITETGRAATQAKTVRERWFERRSGLIDAVACVMKRGIAEGEIRQKIPPRTLAGLFLGLLRARAHDMEHAGITPLGDRPLVDLFCAGACGKGGAPAVARAPRRQDGQRRSRQ